MQRITTNLWFDTEAEEAANFYVSIFRHSRIVSVSRYTEAGPREAGEVMVVEFELDGQRFIGINGGPQFTFDEAISLQVNCETQDEVDYYWDKLTDGGEEGPCGWLKDRYGLSWQVTPTGMDELFKDPDQDRAARAMQAMLGMRKIDLEELRRAADEVEDEEEENEAEVAAETADTDESEAVEVATEAEDAGEVNEVDVAADAGDEDEAEVAAEADEVDEVDEVDVAADAGHVEVAADPADAEELEPAADATEWEDAPEAADDQEAEQAEVAGADDDSAPAAPADAEPVSRSGGWWRFARRSRRDRA